MRKFDVSKFVTGLHDYLGKILKPLVETQRTLLERVKALEDRGPPKDGIDGKSVTVDDVRPLVEELVAAIPKPQDGKDADETAIVHRVLVDARAPIDDLIKELPAMLDERDELIKERLIEKIPRPENGKDGVSPDPALIAEDVIAKLEPRVAKEFVEIREIIDGYMAAVKPRDGKDGTSVTIDDVRPLVEELIAAIPKPQDGKDVDMDAVVQLITEHIERAVAQIPKPKDGEDGKSVTIDEVRAVIEELIAAIPKPKDGEDGEDGKSVTLEMVMGEIGPEVRAYLESIPKPKNGEDGKNVTIEDVRPIIEKLVAEIPRPKDGTSVALNEVIAVLGPDVNSYLEGLPKPRDGEDGEDGKDCDQEAVLRECRDLVESELTITKGNVTAEVRSYLDSMPRPKDGKDGTSVELKDVERWLEERVNGWALDFERRAHSIFQAALDKMPIPKDGKDGLGFDDMDVQQTGKRVVTLTFKRGEIIKEFPIKFPGMLYDEDVYVRGKSYEHGDCVSWAGSFWSARRDTSAEPGANNNDWRLVAKRGRDGKDGIMKQPKGHTVVSVGGGK